MTDRAQYVHQLRLLQPALRAYALGLLSTTTPQVLSLLLSAVRGSLAFSDAISRANSIVKRQLAFGQFPTACGLTLGGSTLLPAVFWWLWSKLFNTDKLAQHSVTSYYKINVLVRFLASFLSALASFELLNQRKNKGLRARRVSVLGEVPLVHDAPTSQNSQIPSRRRRSSVALSTHHSTGSEAQPGQFKLAGRTLDLTLFVFVRAADVVITSLWERTASKRQQKKSIAKAQSLVENLAAPSIFALSSSLIMWSWFFNPDRLPRTYNAWIASAAQIDPRLIDMLRQCRLGRFVYGEDTGLAPVLQSMCRDFKFPIEWGDPAKTIPVPCELYHSGAGPSCEWHAVTRFATGFRFAMRMYVPLSLLILLRRKPSKRSTTRALMDASQSSAFLGAFIALFYYGVCLARNRVGPRIFSSKTITPTMWDGGLCVGAGCMLCGWSIFFEKHARRQEIAFFVAPRALATLFPRRYKRKYLWCEEYTFSICVAVLLTAAQMQPRRVRGVFGRLLHQIYR